MSAKTPARSVHRGINPDARFRHCTPPATTANAFRPPRVVRLVSGPAAYVNGPPWVSAHTAPRAPTKASTASACYLLSVAWMPSTASLTGISAACSTRSPVTLAASGRPWRCCSPPSATNGPSRPPSASTLPLSSRRSWSTNPPAPATACGRRSCCQRWPGPPDTARPSPRTVWEWVMP